VMEPGDTNSNFYGSLCTEVMLVSLEMIVRDFLQIVDQGYVAVSIYHMLSTDITPPYFSYSLNHHIPCPCPLAFLFHVDLLFSSLLLWAKRQRITPDPLERILVLFSLTSDVMFGTEMVFVSLAT
jgi:hypothetical protein